MPKKSPESSSPTGLPAPRFMSVVEANRWQKVRLVRSFLQVLIAVLRVHPDVVITTGAALGYFAVRLAKLLGARTAWVDGIANAEELSLSGMKAGAHVDFWLTQWEHLAKPGGPQFHGSIL